MTQNYESNVLVAAMHDVRPFVTILRAVNFNTTAAVAISNAGLAVVVDDAKLLIANAYIPREIFDEYHYNPENSENDQPESQTQHGAWQESDKEEPTLFYIHLNTVLECLNIFGSGTSTLLYGNGNNDKRRKRWAGQSDDSDEDQGQNERRKKNVLPKGNTTLDRFFPSSDGKKTGMRMTYAGQGHPLVLILAEDASGPITTCEIQTTEEEGVPELNFDDSLKVIKIILRSSWLSDALSELDPSCDKLTFLGIPASEETGSNEEQPKTKATLRITAEGTFGSTQMDYPYARDVLETFECLEPVKFTYRMTHIASALKAMQTSLKTSLRIDQDGLLSLQFMMTAAGPGIFIEFRCLPLNED